MMVRSLNITKTPLAALLLACLAPAVAGAARPTVKQALTLKPVQADADIDTPTDKEAADCRLDVESRDGVNGWVVRADDGRTLRRFLDSNGDNKVDQWCYFKDGVEVYRDLDSDFDGKADEYRWLGTAGIRWGLDTDEDGIIDRWKRISAEEVTEEVVAALAKADTKRFERLLVTGEELKNLGLGKEHEGRMRERVAEARRKFADLAKSQSLLGPNSRWIHFGANRPGVLAAGRNGALKDIVVYDNVAAVVEDNGKHSQLAIGTIVQVGDVWRLTGLPSGLVEGPSSTTSAGFFFGDGIVQATGGGEPGAGLTAKVQELVTELETIDEQLGTEVSPTIQARLNAKRSDVLESLATAAQGTPEYESWIRQLADTVSAAVQSGQYPAGVERLAKLRDSITAAKQPRDLQAYVVFRYHSAEYGQSLQDPEADFAKIQESWLARLEKFVDTYPTSDDAAEAMLQLAIAQEFAGEEKKAVSWYGKIVNEFSSSSLAAKAAGATRRLESVGQTISLQGTSTEGRKVSIASYRGRVVVLHYWATWCEPCKQDMKILKQLQAKYAGQQLAVLGVNLDTDDKAVSSFLGANRLPWPQLRESDGLDGRLANEMGIVTLPTMLLIDEDGKVVNRSIHATELDTEIGKLVK